MLDAVELEMTLATLMAQQEASGFRFDMNAAERVRARLEEEYSDIEGKLKRTYLYVPGKVFTPSGGMPPRVITQVHQ